MKILSILILFLFLFGCANVQQVTKSGVTFNKYKKIAVLKFNVAASTNVDTTFVQAGPSAGQEVADIFASEFMKRGFDVKQVGKLREQIVDMLTDEQRKILISEGVDAVVTGTVSTYGCAHGRDFDCSAAWAIKMIDLKSNEIVWMANASHSDSGKHLTAQKVLIETIQELEKEFPITGNSRGL